MQNGTTWLNTPMNSVVANNIFNLYGNGISTAKITVVCGDYYDENANKIKNWANGDIIQVGDIVRVDKDNLGNALWKYSDGSNIYFRVTGSSFRHVGVPLVDLELQEVKAIDQFA